MDYPQAKLLADYKLIYGLEPPKNRLTLLNNISRRFLLYELCGLNYRLKNKYRLDFDSSLQTQNTVLLYFTKNEIIYEKYALILEKYTDATKYPIIFSRPSILFAIEEILNSQLPEIENENLLKTDVEWESILKYILAVNYEVANLYSFDKKDVSFENFIPKILPLNEYSTPSHPLYTPYRGLRLLNHFYNHPKYKEHIIQYFDNKYALKYDEFIFHLMSMYVNNTGSKPEYEFWYKLLNNNLNHIFTALSIRYQNSQYIKLLNIKKSPFIKDTDSSYLLADNTLLSEKAYELFLNDFWFDYLKNEPLGKQKIEYAEYRGEFGLFFEKYIKELLQNCFKNDSESILLLFDDLKIRTRKGEIEISDIYFRQKNKVILGQAKGVSIYDIEKYSGDSALFYGKDQNSFYNKFGLDQLFKSILNLDKYVKEFDDNFPDGLCEIYPVIVFNDKALQTPFVSDIFIDKFKTMVKEYSFNKLKIHALQLIHISDWEEMEYEINKDSEYLWRTLEKNVHKPVNVHFEYERTNDSISERVPKRVMDTFHELIRKYKT